MKFIKTWIKKKYKKVCSCGVIDKKATGFWEILEKKTIVIPFPHRFDDVIRLNPDLTGRISVIEIKTGEQKSLKEIANKVLGESCKCTCKNLPNSDVVRVLKSRSVHKRIEAVTVSVTR